MVNKRVKSRLDNLNPRWVNRIKIGEKKSNRKQKISKLKDEAKRNNSKVLVHCQAGVSRSPTIVIAYLMRQFGISTNDAFNKVREKRPIISPNIVFMSQLMDYESRLKPSLFNQFATRHFSNCAINTSTTSSAVSDQQENVVNINNSVVENSKSSAEANKSPIECN